MVVVKQEHEAMAAELDDALAWSKQDYVQGEMERQHRALQEIADRRRGREVGGIVVLDDSDEEVVAPSMLFRPGDPGQGSSSSAAPKDPPTNDDDDSGDYTVFYSLFGMK